jgi:DNA polymerase-4
MTSSDYKWLFLDLNSYFASVEQQERPHLRGRPMIVVPMESDHTCAIAASKEAKAFGIKTGTKVRDAKALCPGLQCVLARHDVYVQYHQQIIYEVDQHAPIAKVWSIDEMSVRLPQRQQTKEQALALSV